MNAATGEERGRVEERDGEGPGQGAEGQWLSVRPRRLSAPVDSSARLPSYAKLGLQPLIDEALRWQLERSGAMFFELGVASPAHTGRDRFHELGGLFGSTAEVVILAAAAEVEIALLRSAIESGHLRREYGMCQRFYADAICNSIVSAANRMLNMGFRIAMIHPDYPWGVAVKPRSARTPFPPFSENRRDWVDLGATAAFRDVVSASKHRALIRLHGAIDRMVRDPAWVAVDDQRGEDHHRWRFESPYVAGLNRRSAWVEGDGFVSISGPEHDYTDANNIVNEVCTTAHCGLLRLKRAMHEFHDAFQASVPIVSQGSVGYAAAERTSAT